MTTKEQERKALEQIKKIVEGLGKNSYLATAFEGAFEDAEYNIRDDAAYSMKSRWESVKANRDSLAAKVYEQEKEIKALNTKIEQMQVAAEKKEDCILSQSKGLEELVEKLNEAKESATQNWNKLREAEDKLDEKEEEIIHLKAKLYDLMIK